MLKRSASTRNKNDWSRKQLSKVKNGAVAELKAQVATLSLSIAENY
jgi:hypothetical protein